LADPKFRGVESVAVSRLRAVALRPLVSQIDALDEAIGAIDKGIAMSVKADETAKRLMTVPGVGPVTASAIMPRSRTWATSPAGASSPPSSA
jgi:transposase